MIGAERIAAALGASVILHGAALAALEQLPRGWKANELFAGDSSAGALRASLRPAARPPDAAIAVRQQPAAVFAEKRSGARQPPSLPGVVAPHGYYPARLLDERPQVRVHVEPAFPAGAPESGRVALRLFIGADGRVEEVAVTESDPPGVFEQAAAQAFGRAQFTPGKIRGEVVKSLMSIEVLFGAPAALQ